MLFRCTCSSLVVSIVIFKFFFFSYSIYENLFIELFYPDSFYSEVLCSSFSISFFPGWCVFPGGDNSKAPLLPAKAIKLYSDAQVDKAEVL